MATDFAASAMPLSCEPQAYCRVDCWYNPCDLRECLSGRLNLCDQPYQCCNRPDAEFFHHPAAMHLDGLHDGTQIASDLLVQPPGDHVREHLALARRQRCHPRTDVSQLVLGAAHLGIV